MYGGISGSSSGGGEGGFSSCSGVEGGVGVGGRAMGEEDAGTDPRDDPCLSEGAFAGVAWEGCRRSYKVLLMAQHNTHTCAEFSLILSALMFQ